MKIKLEKKWSEYLTDKPETGMGYQIADIEFKDGSIVKDVKILNSQEAEIPIPYSNKEIKSIEMPKMKKVAIRMRIKPPKRRDPGQRLKSRLYYRKNRAKIRLQRRRYLRKYRSTLKHRKLFFRYKPTWFKKPPKHVKPKTFKVVIPKKVKFHAT